MPQCPPNVLFYYLLLYVVENNSVCLFVKKWNRTFFLTNMQLLIWKDQRLRYNYKKKFERFNLAEFIAFIFLTIYRSFVFSCLHSLNTTIKLKVFQGQVRSMFPTIKVNKRHKKLLLLLILLNFQLLGSLLKQPFLILNMETRVS